MHGRVPGTAPQKPACSRYAVPQGFGAIAAIEYAPQSLPARHAPPVRALNRFLRSTQMIGKLNEEFAFNSAALRLRSERQRVLSANIANADTPGYKAQDFDFKRALGAALAGGAGATAARAADPRHIPVGPRPGSPDLQYRIGSQPSIDGNSVEMDAERAQFADNAIRYETSLRMLNGQIKSMMSAITG
jgi:flagellar basal-body rod protein FlgB